MKQALWRVAEGEISRVTTAAHRPAVRGRLIGVFDMRASKAHRNTQSAVLAGIGPRAVDHQAVVQADLARRQGAS